MRNRAVGMLLILSMIIATTVLPLPETAYGESENAVAMIGETEYESLADAFKNASGKEIELLKDVELTEPIEVSTDNGDVIIRLNGNSISVTGENKRVFNVVSTRRGAGDFYILADNNAKSKINGEIYLENNTNAVIDTAAFDWDNIKYDSAEYGPCVDIATPVIGEEAEAECIWLSMTDESGHLFFKHIYKYGEIYFAYAQIPNELKEYLNIAADAKVERWANYVSFSDISPDGKENSDGGCLVAVKSGETIEQAIARDLEYAKANYPEYVESGLVFTEPVYEGYDLSGWYTANVQRDETYQITSIEYNRQVSLSSTVTSDTELYSKWEKTKPVIIDISGKTAKLSYTTVKYDGTAKKPTVTISGLKEGIDFTVSYSNNTYRGTATVTIRGIGAYTGTIRKTFEITKPDGIEIVFGSSSAKRFYGSNRYETAIQAARVIKVAQGVDKFDNIIVACGNDYADALAGSYLSKVKNAPIILVNKGAEATTKQYIDENLKSGGTVYILGGEGVVSMDFEKSLSGYTVKRLGGKDRFETNLLILKETGVGTEDILVCSGLGFADALSASAVGKPILLVGNKLTETQKTYLGNLSKRAYYIIGGTGAVSTSVETEVNNYGSVKRVGGANRYETSEKVAREFFGGNVDAIVVAYGLDFPDGLCGGAMAIELGCPLLLATNNDLSNVKSYVGDAVVQNLAVMGGPALISNKAANEILR